MGFYVILAQKGGPNMAQIWPIFGPYPKGPRPLVAKFRGEIYIIFEGFGVLGPQKGVIWGPRGPQNDPFLGHFLAHFWATFGTPFWALRAQIPALATGGWPVPVKRGSNLGPHFELKMTPFLGSPNPCPKLVVKYIVPE